MAVDGRQIRTADAREPRPDAHPPPSRPTWFVDVAQGERTDGRTLARQDPSRHQRGGVARRFAFEHERLHRAARINGASGSSLAGPPDAFANCSTSQPRLRAIAASRVSGLTATGKPTASSIGRSDAESAYATDSASESPSASA